MKATLQLLLRSEQFMMLALPYFTRFLILMLKQILEYEKTLPRWYSVNAQGGSGSASEKMVLFQLHANFFLKFCWFISSFQPCQWNSPVTVQEAGKVIEPASQVDRKEVTSSSPLESISLKPRISGLGNESLKIKRTELSQKITLALIPALVLMSKSSLTTSLLVLSVYWQIYGFFKEIFLDYIHHDVTRKWVLTYFQVLLLILAKDTFLDFGLVWSPQKF